ncbi:site-specific integrase [Pedobacter nyackensis]|uniref:tyrosine-type recombinase/integrase n=1 Tax=Pedobacter nyackensis TaxID=475255 RepID=UPI00292E6B17|nr:site-specific integrase [Pedobacter nyackensis]
MFTEPKIVTSDDLNTRSYITFYYDEVRYREYNGKKLNLDISPNYAKTVKEKNRLLLNLQHEFTKALNSGWSPVKVKALKFTSLKDGLNQILINKLASDYSKTYKRDLEKVYNQFIAHLPTSILNQAPKYLTYSDVEGFFNQFRSSNRHYMNKRTTLSVFFSEMQRKELISANLIARTPRAKAKAVLHETFTNDELKQVLGYLESHYPNLHLCCLITYGCFLRPHREVRSLNLNHFRNDYAEIHLSGYENKSGKIRKVFVPEYIRVILRIRLQNVEDGKANIFTLTEQPFNDDYFKTQWSRAKAEMTKAGIIKPLQTIYSFRHTAAVNVYRKTKDLHILRQLLGHSDMIVTLNYLRGLGESDNDHLRDVMPEL